MASIAGNVCVPARAAPSIRLGILQFGTVQWVGDIIQRHALDAANGFALKTTMLANTDAGRVALMADAADIVVSDWMFVAAQRAAGTRLCFAPFSSATGAIMVEKSSPIRSLADLPHRKLGVAGGPVDKSWLIVRAAAKTASGSDLARDADVVYGAPPLLNAKLMQGELDAVLTYWNFAARLEAAGYRQVISVEDCADSLGLPASMPLVGFVFHEDWASQDRDAINGFLAAAASADDILVHSAAEWQQIRPLMNATDDALFDRLKQRFVEGITHPPAEAQEQAAKQVFEVLLRTGGSRATDGLTQLPGGIFWPMPAPHG
ncbi:MAG: NitT/TauT family transport system substrate-binding protein [Acetobacteraceae bacterium]|jgi:NitT/TauT family transport system substrate-binding protein|nr:NitT/TauT family transport system substrate-binding protein [Acetobacteraceae bacterium]